MPKALKASYCIKMKAKGSLKNNFIFWMPMNPAWLRYENSKYAWYSLGFRALPAGRLNFQNCIFIFSWTLSIQDTGVWYMSLKTKIDSIFPEEKSIPTDIMADIPAPIDPYLIDGELRGWKGHM